MGHGAVAVDMPVDRRGLSVDDYADSVVEGLDLRDGEDIYLVGHSMGGFVIPRVAAKLPSARLIFLCAVLSHTSEQQLRENMAATSPAFMGWAGTDSDGRMIMTSENARAAFLSRYSVGSGGLGHREAAAAMADLHDRRAAAGICRSRRRGGLHLGRPHHPARRTSPARAFPLRAGTDRAARGPFAVPVAAGRIGGSARPDRAGGSGGELSFNARLFIIRHPAKAGTHSTTCVGGGLDSRLRGNDECLE